MEGIFNENCTLFATEEDTEHNLSAITYSNISRRCLKMHYKILLEEGKNVHEIHRMISEIDDRNTKASKFLKKLLLSFEYSNSLR